MEVLSILFGIIFWPIVISIWFSYCRREKIGLRLRVLGTVVVIGLPLLGAASLGKYMVLDEPLYFAVTDGNIHRVQSLLDWGADPNVGFKGSLPLEQAATAGDRAMVRLLLAHHAQVDAYSEMNHRTALMAAKENGNNEIVALLQRAGATD